MSKILGTNISAPVVPNDSADIYPSHEAKYGKGGLRTVETTTERDAIPVERRENLMQVSVNALGKSYELNIAGYTGLTESAKLSALTNNANWKELERVNLLNYRNGTGNASFVQLNGSGVYVYPDLIGKVGLTNGSNTVIAKDGLDFIRDFSGTTYCYVISNDNINIYFLSLKNITATGATINYFQKYGKIVSTTGWNPYNTQPIGSPITTGFSNSTGDYEYYFNLDLDYSGVDNIASGMHSTALGISNKATGLSSYVEGFKTQATGDFSHAEGNNTIASGSTSHAEGNGTIAGGIYSHAEGQATQATGSTSHAEGFLTKAFGNSSHAEGSQTQATGENSHAEGFRTQATGYASHTEGNTTIATGTASHAEGHTTQATGYASHAEGYITLATAFAAHAGGLGSGTGKEVIAAGQASFNHSEVSVTGITGAVAANSAILGGVNHSISSTATKSVILGGSGITATAANTVYVPNLNVNGIEVTTTGATTGQALIFNGTKYAPATVSGGSSGTKTVATIADRNALTLAERTPLMQVAVIATGQHFILKTTNGYSGLSQAQKDTMLNDNNNWQVLSPTFSLNTTSNGIYRFLESGLSLPTQAAKASGGQSFSITPSATASGVYSIASGVRTYASGEAAFAGGSSTNYDVTASGKNSFNYSEAVLKNSTAAADNSVILGGTNNNISSTALRSAVIGGNNITATQPDTLYVKYLNIGGVDFDTAGTEIGSTLRFNGTKFVAGANVLITTHADILTSIADSKINVGQYYLITQRPFQGAGTAGDILVYGVSDTAVSLEGYLFASNPDYVNIPMWHADILESELYSHPDTGELLVIHKGKTYCYRFGTTNDNPSDGTASWQLNDEFGNGYNGNTVSETDYVEYDILNDWINRRVDKRGNDIRYDREYDMQYNGYGESQVANFKWGYNQCYSNRFVNCTLDIHNYIGGAFYGNTAEFSTFEANTMKDAYISFNNIYGSYVYNNTFTNANFYSNVLNRNSNVNDNTLLNSSIGENFLTINSTIQGNNLDASGISNNTLLNNTHINYNDLINGFVTNNSLNANTNIESRTFESVTYDYKNLIDVNNMLVAETNADAIAEGLTFGTQYRSSDGLLRVVY